MKCGDYIIVKGRWKTPQKVIGVDNDIVAVKTPDSLGIEYYHIDEVQLCCGMQMLGVS